MYVLHIYKLQAFQAPSKAHVRKKPNNMINAKRRTPFQGAQMIAVKLLLSEKKN
jgi:hypothetical protein